LSAADYFKLVRDARDMVKIPDDLKAPSKQLQLSPTAIEAKLAAANPDFPKTAFRVSCYRSGELEEIRVCLNKNLSPRGCGGASTCAAGTVQIRPVR
jgi:ribonuclease T2